MLITKLPPTLEDGEALIKRRAKAAQRKEMWRGLYKDCYRYALPMRETFDWQTPGTFKNNILYDSTLQEATYTAANTMAALLFPSWQYWMKAAPGGSIPKEFRTKELIAGLQEITETFFDFLDNSNFSTVANEVALDLQIGTGAMRFDEGPTDDNPFVFSSIPLSAIELEEGPNGTVETTWMERAPLGRNLVRMYSGLDTFDLPQGLQEKIDAKPDEPVKIIQGVVYDPLTAHYYGVVVWAEANTIIWRYDYGKTSPDIVARANKAAGEIYGRGRVTLALSDARTLDRMQEFVLRHSALQVAPPMTGISDGVLNPYTAVLRPNTILPVGSNDQRNPSLRVMEFGGDFRITDTIMRDLRDRVRRTMLGPEPSEGPVKSATEMSIMDRNRLWAMGGEYSRIQIEFLFKVVARGMDILQRRGLIPKFKVDGREVALKFTSPFARSQDAEDLLAFERTVGMMMQVAPDGSSIPVQLKSDMFGEWLSRKTGLDQALVNNKAEREQIQKQAAEAAAQLAQQAQEAGVMPNG